MNQSITSLWTGIYSLISHKRGSIKGITTLRTWTDRKTLIIGRHRPSASKLVPSRTSRIDSLSCSAKGFTYRCQGSGALLSLPHDGHEEDVIRRKAFEKYIQDNVASWFEWSKNKDLPVEHMEDLILVTGCTLVDSWAAAAFVGRSETAEISLVAQTRDESERSFECSNIRGDVTHHCGYFDLVCFPLFRVLAD